MCDEEEEQARCVLNLITCYSGAKMQKHNIVILIFFLFIASPIAGAQNSHLRLSMESDKVQYKVGEEILLHCSIKNVSDSVLGFYPYVPTDVIVKDTNDAVCIKEECQIIVWHDSFVLLVPGEIYEYTVKGKILIKTGGISDAYKEGTLRESAKGYPYKEVSGIFIEFHGGCYYLNGNYGKYKITSSFSDASETMVAPTKSDPKNNWHGQLTSNTVVIEIIK